MHRRLAVVPLLVTLALCLLAPTASADQPSKLANTLAALWTKVLETPSASNPFGTGGPGFACWDLGGTVAALAPDPVPSCTVKTGTKIFVSGSSAECSTFPNDCPGANATEGQLETAAKKLVDSSAPPVTLDGKPVAVTFVKPVCSTSCSPPTTSSGFPRAAATRSRWAGSHSCNPSPRARTQSTSPRRTQRATSTRRSSSPRAASSTRQSATAPLAKALPSGTAISQVDTPADATSDR